MDEYKTRLQELRIIKHRTQQEMALDLGYNLRTYQEYERGNISIPIVDIPKIANYFNVSADYLVGMSNEMLPQAKEFQQATGLSESAIANISKYKDNERIMDCINEFISSNEFIAAIGNIMIAKTPFNPFENQKENIQEKAMQAIDLYSIATGTKKRRNAKVSLSGESLNEWMLYKASQSIWELINRIAKGDKDNGKR